MSIFNLYSNKSKNRLNNKKEKLEKEKLKIEGQLLLVNEILNDDKQSLPFLMKGTKIIKKDEILKACKAINGIFTTKYIKKLLEKSDNEEIRNITLAYISGQLCKLVQTNKLKIEMQMKDRGASNVYSNIDI